ncbi:MAG TPA: SLC13 family permease [Candidatus Limnocylindria bacterium]|jgi:di/tricarboxylate transporter|nr:SLC13 family permease [Candidatus Limnocylindria bacterium]
MELGAWVTLAVLAVLVAVLFTEKAAPAPAVLSATLLLMLAGIVTPEQAFAGFSNEAPIIIASLLIVARAVDVAGIMQPIVALLFRGAASSTGILARLLFPLAGISAFVNNTTLVAMTIPAVVDISARRNLPASRFLMGVSYAAILGGVVTAIGTSTNLTVSGLLTDAGMRPLGLFEPTLVGLPLAVVGVAAVVLLSPRVLPDRSPVGSLAENGRDFTVSMRVEPGGDADGVAVSEAGLRRLQGVFLVEIQRDGRSIAPVAPDERLEGGDLLTFVGRVDNIVDLQRVRGLASTEARQIGSLAGSVHAFYELVVGAGGDLVGQTLKQVDFRARYDAAVIAIHRAGYRVNAKLGDVSLRVGDTLLVLADPEFRTRWRDRPDFLVIAPLSGISPRQPRRAWLVAAVGIGFVLATGSGVVPILHASVAAAMIVVATGVLTIRQARDAVDLQIVVLIAAAFGLGAAVSASGLAQAVAGGLVNAMSPLGDVGTLAAIMVATIVLTELVSHNAAAALMFPIGVAAAATIGADPRPFVIAIMMGASLSFLTPLGYQTNLMVYGLGGYRFSDFSRVGVPLNVVTIGLSLVLIPLVFPFR